jgi:hypothetical protein
MPSSPHPVALSVYESLFARHHGTMLRIQQEIDRCRNGALDRHSGNGDPLLERARQGERVALKLIDAWHREVTLVHEHEGELRRAIHRRFARPQSR